MAKLPTLKKSEIDQVVTLAIAKIKKWTDKEITKLSFKEGRPQCLHLTDDHFRVGNHTIKKVNEGCWRLSYDETDYDFMFKTSAINWSLAKQLHLFELATSLKYADQQYAVHYADFVLFKARLETALKKGDTWDIQRYEARKKQSQTRYLEANARLQKCMRNAKYYKLIGNPS